MELTDRSKAAVVTNKNRPSALLPLAAAGLSWPQASDRRRSTLVSSTKNYGTLLYFVSGRRCRKACATSSARKEPALPNLIVTEFISVDGIAEVEKLPGVTWNDKMQKFKDDELADSGAMLLERTAYEIFTGSWPKESETSPTGPTPCRNISPRRA